MNKSELNIPALAPLVEPVPRAERVYEALLNGIIQGELAPGAQLNADNLAQLLKVSTTPVRDALNHLVKDGLVHKLPYQGWFVSRFQEREIRDIYEMRAGLECFSVRLACERRPFAAPAPVAREAWPAGVSRGQQTELTTPTGAAILAIPRGLLRTPWPPTRISGTGCARRARNSQVHTSALEDILRHGLG